MIGLARITVVLVAALGTPCLPAALAIEPVKEPPLVVAGLMYRPVKWDKDANQRALDDAIREAHRRGARIVVTPEGALEGYLVNDVRNTTGPRRPEAVERFNRVAEPIDGPHVRHFQKLCAQLKIFLVLGFLEADKDRTYNTAILLGPEGQLVGKYRKTHFAQGYKTGDKKGNNPIGYTRGTDYPVFEAAGHKVGIMICFDRRVAKVARQLARNGADVILNPSYGMMGDCNRKYISTRSRENGVPILFVHPSQTVLAASDGEIRVDVRPHQGEDRICLVTIDP